MTIEAVPGSDVRYFLINLAKDGHERGDDPHAPSGRLSDLVSEQLSAGPVTDVFLMSHGWKSDIPAAKDQYGAWIGSMLACTEDLARVRAARPGFTPLLIGLHWPSLPWGDEEAATHGAAFAIGASDGIEQWIDDAADKLVDTIPARAALRTIFSAAGDDLLPDELPTQVQDAYRLLYAESRLGADGVAGAPGLDMDGFDPEAIYQASLDDASAFGRTLDLSALLTPLRQLSFWQMKARARAVGESGAAALLRRLQAITGGRGVRFHLMGHSFGCIVASAAVNGPGGDSPLPRPVSSLFLVQGALSLWAYCADIPEAPGQQGYFYPLIGKRKVAGPIVATQSQHDTAVRCLYPLGAGIAGEMDFAPGRFPKYGGLGTFGVQGPGIALENRQMLPPDADYGFRGGRVYNLEASGFINQGTGASGAHNDIAKPAVAHAFWQAISASEP